MVGRVSGGAILPHHHDPPPPPVPGTLVTELVHLVVLGASLVFHVTAVLIRASVRAFFHLASLSALLHLAVVCGRPLRSPFSSGFDLFHVRRFGLLAMASERFFPASFGLQFRPFLRMEPTAANDTCV